jgi:hypothetical protein
MRLIRTVVLLSGLSVTLGAQATTRPTTAVAGTVVRPAGADLVIDNLDLKHTPGVGAAVKVEANALRVTGLVMVARITNRGTERWAASNASVGFSLKAGRAEDAGEGRRAAGGVSTAPAQTSGALGRSVMAPFGPFRAEARIPGSLAPGESREVTVLLKNRAENLLVIFERDKYYTLEATLRTRGDVNPANNRSLRVGRFDMASSRFQAQWEALVTPTAAGGTVRVNAPPRP